MLGIDSSPKIPLFQVLHQLKTQIMDLSHFSLKLCHKAQESLFPAKFGH